MLDRVGLMSRKVEIMLIALDVSQILLVNYGISRDYLIKCERLFDLVFSDLINKLSVGC